MLYDNNPTIKQVPIDSSTKFCIVEVDDLHAWFDYVLGQIKQRTEKIVVNKNEYCGSTWIYRGQSDAEWQLTSSFQRQAKGYPHSIRNHERSLRGKEQAAISSFKAKAWQYVDNHEMTHLEWLMLMRHHGVPTRLVDFTDSPTIALYFALEDDPKGNFAIWALNRDAMEDAYTRSLVGTKIPGMEELFSKYGNNANTVLHDANPTDPIVLKALSHLDNLSLSGATVEMRNDFNRRLADAILSTPLDREPSFPSDVGAIWFYPEKPTPRMKAQQGLFLMPLYIGQPFEDSLCNSLNIVTPVKMDNVPTFKVSEIHKCSSEMACTHLIKFVFPQELLPAVRDVLLLSNCSRDNLYPDIDGVAMHVKDVMRESLSGYKVFSLPNLTTATN